MKISASIIVNLVSSPSLQLDLRVSQPVLLSLKPPLFSQAVLVILTFAHGVMNLFSETLGSTESLGYAQDDLGLRSSCLGTQKYSKFLQSKLQVLTTAQEPAQTSLLSQEPSGTCLEKDSLGYSPFDPGDFGLSESAQSTLETLPCKKNTAEMPPVTQEIIKSLLPVQYSFRFLTHSPLSPEAEEPLPFLIHL